MLARNIFERRGVGVTGSVDDGMRKSLQEGFDRLRLQRVPSVHFLEHSISLGDVTANCVFKRAVFKRAPPPRLACAGPSA